MVTEMVGKRACVLARRWLRVDAQSLPSRPEGDSVKGHVIEIGSFHSVCSI